MGYEGRWAMEAGLDQKPMRGEYDTARFSETLLLRNTPIDALDPHCDLSRYKLVIAPRLWLVDERIAANLVSFVERGGVLCLTAASGVVDEFNKSFNTPRPGPLAKIAGVEVSDLSPLESPVPLSSQAVPGLEGMHASAMADEIHLTTAEALAVYAGGWRTGLPALTRNQYGNGFVYYLGTVIDTAELGPLVDALLSQAGVKRGPVTPDGVFAYERRSADTRLLFVINQNEQTQQVSLSESWQDAFTGETCQAVEIDKVDLRILMQKL
jgi:beta-galactosidase